MGVGTLVMVGTAGKVITFVQFYKGWSKFQIFSQCPPVEPAATAWNEKKYQQIKIQHINFLFIIKCRPGARVHTQLHQRFNLWNHDLLEADAQAGLEFPPAERSLWTRVTAGILRPVRCKSVKYDVMIWLQCHEHVYREHSLSWPSGSWNACREGGRVRQREATLWY